MIQVIHKKLGETPLEALKRAVKSKKQEARRKMSYMGRLDPMAEGELLILSGEDNKNNEKYRNLDKEYEATFLLGVSTDTGDLLGLIDRHSCISPRHQKDNRHPSTGRGPGLHEVQNSLDTLKQIKSQKFPWFSAQTHKGKKLFDHFKEGNTDFERPSKEIEIKEVELIKSGSISQEDLKNYIFETIALVNGDFRQEEILNKWDEFFSETKQKEFTTAEVTLRVTSGTYIRGLTENLSESLGTPVVLMKLNRTKIFLENI